MSADTKFRTPLRATQRATLRSGFALVFALVAANAGTQFAIQAWMSYRFAKDVWGIPRPLCAAIIVALDLFAAMFMIFTYLLRTARARTRGYVWLVFAAGVAAQLFAAELYGAHEEWAAPVRVFAGLPALFLAASLHGLIIWRNHAGSPTDAPVRTETERQPSPTIVDVSKVGPATPPEQTRAVNLPAAGTRSPRAERRAKARTGGDRGRPDRQVLAVKRVIEGGETPPAVARDLGVSVRSVQGWVKQARQHAPSVAVVSPGEIRPEPAPFPLGAEAPGS